MWRRVVGRSPNRRREKVKTLILALALTLLALPAAAQGPYDLQVDGAEIVIDGYADLDADTLAFQVTQPSDIEKYAWFAPRFVPVGFNHVTGEMLVEKRRARAVLLFSRVPFSARPFPYRGSDGLYTSAATHPLSFGDTAEAYVSVDTTHVGGVGVGAGQLFEEFPCRLLTYWPDEIFIKEELADTVRVRVYY